MRAILEYLYGFIPADIFTQKIIEVGELSEHTNTSLFFFDRQEDRPGFGGKRLAFNKKIEHDI